MRRIGFSIEIFPPKITDGVEKIYPALEGLSRFFPDFISVTCSAGGSAKGLTGEVSSLIQEKYGIKSVAHLTAAGMERQDILSSLDGLKDKGVHRILALRGDLSADRKLTDYRYATDLMAEIRTYGGFELYAACYPEGHAESASMKEDIAIMKKKYDLGVRNFLSQLFFDNTDFYRLLDMASAVGIRKGIHAGIMPITNTNQILRTVKLSGAKIPERLAKNIARYENDPESFYKAGIEYAAESILDLVQNGAEAIHFYAMNSVKVTSEIYSLVAGVLSRS